MPSTLEKCECNTEPGSSFSSNHAVEAPYLDVEIVDIVCHCLSPMV